MNTKAIDSYLHAFVNILRGTIDFVFDENLST